MEREVGLWALISRYSTAVERVSRISSSIIHRTVLNIVSLRLCMAALLEMTMAYNKTVWFP